MENYTAQKVADFFEVEVETLLNNIEVNRNKFTHEHLSKTETGEFVFTEKGLWIVSTVLSSPKAIKMHIELIRAVVNEKDFSIFELFKQ